MMVQVGWQIQQRNFRLGASAPIGNREQSTRSPRTPLLQHHTSFSFSFSVRRRSFPLESTSRRLHSLSPTALPDTLSLPCDILDLDSTSFPPLLGPNNRNSKNSLRRYALRRVLSSSAARIAHCLPRHSRVKHAFTSCPRPRAFVLALGHSHPPTRPIHRHSFHHGLRLDSGPP